MKPQNIAVLIGLSLFAGSAAGAAPRQSANRSAVVVMPNGSGMSVPPSAGQGNDPVNISATLDVHHYIKIRTDANFVYESVDPGDSVYSEARSINADGIMIGFYRPLLNSHILGFRFVGISFEPIAISGAVDVFPLWIGDDGTITGAFTDDADRFHGFVLRGDECGIVDDPLLPNSIITGVDRNGGYVGYGFDTPSTIVRFTGAVNPNSIAPLDANTDFWGVNHDGLNSFGNGIYVDVDVIDEIVPGPLATSSPPYDLIKNVDAGGAFGSPSGVVSYNGNTIGVDVPGSDGRVGTRLYGASSSGRIVGVYEEQTGKNRNVNIMRGFVAIPAAAQ